jgi:uncharacterized CHY-type Zn-finger protein
VYSPKIAEDLIPKLYVRAKDGKKPMTTLVNEILRNDMERYEFEKSSSKVSVCGSCFAPLDIDEDQTEAFCEKCQTTVFVHCKNVA